MLQGLVSQFPGRLHIPIVLAPKTDDGASPDPGEDARTQLETTKSIAEPICRALREVSRVDWQKGFVVRKSSKGEISYYQGDVKDVLDGAIKYLVTSFAFIPQVIEAFGKHWGVSGATTELEPCQYAIRTDKLPKRLMAKT